MTPLHNATGTPAMTVPLHWTADGLPVGVHFAGRYGEEATLLALAAELGSGATVVRSCARAVKSLRNQSAFDRGPLGRRAVRSTPSQADHYKGGLRSSQLQTASRIALFAACLRACARLRGPAPVQYAIAHEGRIRCGRFFRNWR